jgi:hypothetical protein
VIDTPEATFCGFAGCNLYYDATSVWDVIAQRCDSNVPEPPIIPMAQAERGRPTPY